MPAGAMTVQYEPTRNGWTIGPAGAGAGRESRGAALAAPTRAGVATAEVGVDAVDREVTFGRGLPVAAADCT